MKAILMEELQGGEFKEDLRKCSVELKTYFYLTMAFLLACLISTEKYMTGFSLKFF